MHLSDTQSILLVTAAGRTTRSLLPLPDSLKPGGGTSKALTALVRKGLAEERPTDIAAAVHRQEDDASYGIFITPAGAAAIGLEPEQLEGAALPPAEAAAAPPPAVRASTGTATVIDLLQRPAGATLVELTAATGWLPHTTRAALSGLRKKGHDIVRGKREGVTCYTLGGQA